MCKIIPLQLFQYIMLRYMHKYFNVENLQLEREVLLVKFSEKKLK
jgi:hypothetical protein